MSYPNVVIGRDRARKRVKLGGLNIQGNHDAWTDETEESASWLDFDKAPEVREPSGEAQGIVFGGPLLTSEQIEALEKSGDPALLGAEIRRLTNSLAWEVGLKNALLESNERHINERAALIQAIEEALPIAVGDCGAWKQTPESIGKHLRDFIEAFGLGAETTAKAQREEGYREGIKKGREALDKLRLKVGSQLPVEALAHNRMIDILKAELDPPDEPLGEWHLDLTHNSVCVELKKRIEGEHTFYDLSWSGGGLFGAGLPVLRGAEDFRDTALALADRLRGMKPEEILERITSKTNEFAKYREDEEQT